ncbi:MAG: TrkA family potassium uptake protein [Sorangiineae bacterium]|nr:TrkA family potassium uptake protein [Polyangiaceae bacterium]MEB2324220.1 TrkA family potassium uptake protein [Sorangiineae bacterium]
MRLLIAGGGRTAVNVASHLRGGGHDVAIIDASAERTRVAFEKHGLVAFLGDATEETVLRDAELERADVVVAMLPRDADNLSVAVQARLAGVPRVLVRVRDPSYAKLFHRVGIERVLSETEIVIGAFTTTIEHDRVHHAMPLGAGQSLAFEIEIPQDSAVAGRSVMELASDPEFPKTCVFAGLYEHDGNVVAPRGSSIIYGGRTVLLVARREDIARVSAFFAPADSPARGSVKSG